MGEKFAHIAQPVKIHYRKNPKTKKQTATLDIATTSSYATTLPYQKDLILERINRIFGDQWISDIKFIASEVSEAPISRRKINTPLTGSEKKYLSTMLEEIDDPEFKARLESLGKAILMERKK